MTVQIDIGTVEVVRLALRGASGRSATRLRGRSHLNTTHSQHYGAAKARPTSVPKLLWFVIPSHSASLIFRVNARQSGLTWV